MSHQSMSETARSYIFDLDELDEVIARPYLRVSKDTSGRERSPKEQLVDAERAVERKRTWTLGESYGDVGSASQWKRKERAAFERLMTDLRADRFGAHVLILWEASRGSRSVPEWHELLDVLARCNVFVFVTTLSRVFNPRVAYDWKHLMDMGTQSEFEVRQLRERVQRAGDADVVAGNFTGGRRPFGFDAKGVEHDPVEAQLIRDAAKAIIGGDSVRTVAKRWAGVVKTTAGNDWHPGPLANMLRSDRIAGLRSHKGRTVGAAAWKPIIDEVTRKRLLAAMSTRTPVGRGPRTPRELTGFLVCERCGAQMIHNTDTRGTRRYICRKAPGYHGCGKLTIKAEDVERTLGALVTARLSDALARRSVGGPDDADEIAALAAIAADRVELAKSSASMATRLSFAADLDEREAELYKVIAAKAAVSSDALDLLVEDGLEGRPWSELSYDEKRRLLTLLVRSITIGAATKRGSTTFESARVVGLLPDGNERIAWLA